MAGLGLMNRRRAIQSSPSRYNPLDDVEFYSELVGDGSAYIMLPNLTMQRSDTLEVRYSTASKTNQAIFGSRYAKPIMCILSNDREGTSWCYWFGGDLVTILALNHGQPIFGENLTFKTSIGLNSSGIQRRCYYQNGNLIYSVDMGDLEETTTANMLVFATNQANSNNVDARIMSGSIFSFVISDIDGNVKVDLRPCVFAGQAGMWDMVTNQFYGNNNTTGQFSVR